MKILMATMALDIGGAETHIVELSKELVRQGHEVLVASNGGVYVSELTEAGIRHFEVPMHQRRVGGVLCARRLMAGIIRREKPDVVHAHARIPAFVCGSLQRRLRFPFVTTAHWVFESGGVLRYLTNWGQRTIAVSEDIKAYLMREYQVPEGHISVTINGIDTDKFSPTVRADGVREQWGLGESPVIASVSRMDEDRALVAKQLVALAPQLAAEIPKLRLLIAGGGNAFDEVYAAAEQANERIGYPCVVMTGSVTSINEIVAASSLFVGVSRAVLEAMAAGKPVIVAGNEGYQGLLTPEGLDEAMAGNFCCRGMELSQPERLLTDILAAWALPETEKERLGQFGRQAIFDHYSVRRMAEDAAAAYQSVRKQRYRVLLSGYYGFSNAGDDAILQSIHEGILSTSDAVDITVLSDNPASTTTQYGLEALPRFRFWTVLRALRRCDALVSGGGSLLQDRTSTRSILYYLSVMRGAQLLGKPVMLYANGIGPVQKPANRRRVKKVVDRATLVTLRDANSARELEAMGVRRPALHVTADPVFNLMAASRARAWELLRSCGIAADRPFAVVSVRPWPGTAAFSEDLAALCDYLSERYGMQILFLPMQPAADVPASLQVGRHMRTAFCVLGDGAGQTAAESKLSPSDLMAVLGEAKLCLAMRLHTLIFAAHMATPLLGLVYDPKVASYLEELDMPSAGDVSDFSLPQAQLLADKLMDEYEAVRQRLQETSAALGKAALDNDRLLLEMLEGIR